MNEHVRAQGLVHVEWPAVPDSGRWLETGDWHAVRPGEDGPITAECGMNAARHEDAEPWSPGRAGNCPRCTDRLA